MSRGTVGVRWRGVASAPLTPSALRSPLNRRRFLALGGIGLAALAAGGWLVARGGGDAHYASLCPGAHPAVLDTKELGVLAALCARVCPGPGPSHPGAAAVRVAERIDRELSFHGSKIRGDVKAALFVLEHGGWLHGEPTRFTRRGAGDQDAYLRRMAIAGREIERQVFSNLRLLALFFYYVDDRTWKAIGYAGPLTARKAPPADSRPPEAASGG